jgi:hypothetical protein
MQPYSTVHQHGATIGNGQADGRRTWEDEAGGKHIPIQGGRMGGLDHHPSPYPFSPSDQRPRLEAVTLGPMFAHPERRTSMCDGKPCHWRTQNVSPWVRMRDICGESPPHVSPALVQPQEQPRDYSNLMLVLKTEIGISICLSHTLSPWSIRKVKTPNQINAAGK